MLARANTGGEDLAAEVERMSTALAHRGPDGASTWVDAAAGLAFGHRRLAVLDVSPAGTQPMVSDDGRWVLVFNGETYNFKMLRRQQERVRSRAWRGHSDTEVMLSLIQDVGVRAAVEQFEGMFAIAVWDREERALWLARDRAGEKPLYYGWNQARFCFSSELKALLQLPEGNFRLDRAAATSMLRFGYVPAPASILVGISKLLPGHVLRLSPTDIAAQATPVSQEYWSLRHVVAEGLSNPFAGTDAEAIDALESLLSDAVARQMVSDVPLGAFLSGGIDSSTIVALMQRHASQPVRTFAIGFTEAAYDEAPHAKRVAAHLGTAHTELYAASEDALRLVPRLPVLYDEPFADSSQLPTFLVAELARQHVTVSLSGDAGDELFGGYQRYFIGERLWSRMQTVPRPLRAAGGRAALALSAERWDELLRVVRPLLPSRLRRKDLGLKIHKIAGIASTPSFEEFYRGIVSAEMVPGRYTGVSESASIMEQTARWPVGLSGVPWMMALDFLSYLPDDILVKVDRAAMGTSLETRVPFLDPRVIEFAWRLPMHLRVRNGTGKWLLRQVLARHVPTALTERPKQGFGVPIDRWLRGPLASWADGLLDPARIAARGILDPDVVQREWRLHRSGKADRHLTLWPVLMLEAWIERTGIT